MDNAKYIMVELNGLETPIIFPAYIQHHEMAMNKTVVSAGFVSIGMINDKVEVEAYGKSVSLRVQARPEDSEILKRTFNLVRV